LPRGQSAEKRRRGISMRKIGYARVSSVGQNLDRQLGALIAEGCDRVFQEKASGKSIKNRPELERAIGALDTRDVLVLAEWDRCTRSMIDGVAIIERINARGALVKGLENRTWIDHAARQRLPGLPERHGRGRAATHRQARKRRPKGCTGARGRGSVASQRCPRSSRPTPGGAWPAERVLGRLAGSTASATRRLLGWPRPHCRATRS
jgi:hypothetical protein